MRPGAYVGLSRLALARSGALAGTDIWRQAWQRLGRLVTASRALGVVSVAETFCRGLWLEGRFRPRRHL